MPISITCPGCESTHSVADELLGKTVKCKKCGELVEIRAPRVSTVDKPATPSRTAVPVLPPKASPAKASESKRKDDEDEEEDRRPARRSRRRDDDDDDRRGKKKSGSAGPLIAKVLSVMLFIQLRAGDDLDFQCLAVNASLCHLLANSFRHLP